MLLTFQLYWQTLISIDYNITVRLFVTEMHDNKDTPLSYQ